MPQIKRALISVSDKTGVVELAGVLHGSGVVILSTGGTAKTLRDANIPVTDVSDYTGSPEILDGRLKTLHPKVHGGLLGIRGNSKHIEEMKANGIEPIDMVVVNLYPFEAAVAKKGCTFEEAIENIDIGGPAMLRAAAKNWQDVAVVVDPADYRTIIDELNKSLRTTNDERRTAISKETCFNLAQKVFAATARYDAAICNYINSLSFPPPITPFGGKLQRESREFPAMPAGRQASAGMTERGIFPSALALTFTKVQDLRYGENPHQKAALYKDLFPYSLPLEGGGAGERETLKGASISSSRRLHGKELSYNNIMDADAAIELAGEFADKTAAVIIKHTNPCGVAVSDVIASPCLPTGRRRGEAIPPLAKAFIKARDCDPTSAFGGIVALTRPVDEATARAIGDTFFEVIIAPGFEARALEILKAKKNLRLLETGAFSLMGGGQGEGGFNLRKVRGGLLVQDYDDIVTDIAECKVVTKRRPTKDELAALDLNWRVVKHVKSNAIVIGGIDRIYGVGAGQTSRVDSVNIAIEKMNTLALRTLNSELRTMASDAFFPFRDSIDLAAGAGVTAIVQPGGSIRDDESIKAADEHNIAMLFTSIRHFRH